MTIASSVLVSLVVLADVTIDIRPLETLWPSNTVAVWATTTEPTTAFQIFIVNETTIAAFVGGSYNPDSPYNEPLGQPTPYVHFNPDYPEQGETLVVAAVFFDGSGPATVPPGEYRLATLTFDACVNVTPAGNCCGGVGPPTAFFWIGEGVYIIPAWDDVMMTCLCPADLDGDGSVGVLDLLAVLAAWGTDPAGPPDFDGGGVGITDLLTLLANWGPCP
jgi:hypothetical protein